MRIISKNLTQGMRPAIFRNRPVHEYYDHLQAALLDADPTGSLKSLFAKPFADGGLKGAEEVSWMSDAQGTPIALSRIPAGQKKAVVEKLLADLKKLREYAQRCCTAGGNQAQYGEFLKSLALVPDPATIMVLDGSRPIVTEWGFVRDDPGQKIPGAFNGWQELETELKRKPEPVYLSSAPQATVGERAYALT